MKKGLALMLALIMALSLCACGGTKESTPGGSAQNAEETKTQSTEFSWEEVCAVVSVNELLPYLEDTLRDPDSLDILSIEVVEDEEFSDHYVKIEYNAANGMGGKEREDAYFKVSGVSLSDNPINNPMGAEYGFGDISDDYYDAVNSNMEVIEVDVDKVMNHLDMDVTEVLEHAEWGW